MIPEAEKFEFPCHPAVAKAGMLYNAQIVTHRCNCGRARRQLVVVGDIYSGSPLAFAPTLTGA
eukprot:18436-Lingulodinium_polyedra.AAC.1